ncbi:MAG TPA: SDR family NAD(P)-dependent oxidoreductase, partial [Tepidisphaeraceae bacterium]
MALPDFSVRDRSVLITGAARGIGRAMARGLAAGGARVAVQDIDENVARAEADAIAAEGGQAIALGGDLTDLTLPERLMAAVVERFGRLDILINNGSIQHERPFGEHTLEQMQRELNANVLASTRLCQLAIPPMQTANWGRIINFSSIQGRSGNDQMPAYA